MNDRVGYASSYSIPTSGGRKSRPAWLRGAPAERRPALEEVHRVLVRDEDGALYPDLAQRVAAAGYAEDVCLRFGELPEDRRSVTPWRGMCEAGVSVFPARKTPAGDYVLGWDWDPLQRALVVVARQDRDAYEVRGWICGSGTCGEPLLRDIWGVEPVPAAAIVASVVPSYELEMWNVRKGGGLDERLGCLPASREGGR
jgi:hypothetical protein